MTEAGSSARDGRSDGQGTARRIRPPRRLPSGRAVVGGLLVALAAVVTFGAHLEATAGPGASYVVARSTVPPGTHLADREAVREHFGVMDVDLVPPLDERAVPASELDQLAGSSVLGPLGRGELLFRTQLADRPAPSGQVLSFGIEPTAALNGRLRAGEHVDVLATYRDGGSTHTAYVVTDVPLMSVAQEDDALVGAGAGVVLTVALEEPAQARELGHALSTADVRVARSGPRDRSGPDDRP